MSIIYNQEDFDMPIYEYQCEICQQIFEKLVCSSGEEEVECPKCGHNKARRILSATGILASSCAKPSAGFS
jgi:putative FmdB family regulatory protein